MSASMIDEIVENWINRNEIVTSRDPVEILDLILMSLKNTIRFNGLCNCKYNVLTHSWLVSQLACDLALAEGFPQRTIDAIEFHGLVHDFGEAIVGDMVYPLKTESFFKESYKKYLDLEEAFVQFVSKYVFGVKLSIFEYVLDADKIIGTIEMIGVSKTNDYNCAFYFKPFFDNVMDMRLDDCVKYKNALYSIAEKLKND